MVSREEWGHIQGETRVSPYFKLLWDRVCVLLALREGGATSQGGRPWFPTHFVPLVVGNPLSVPG